MVVFDSCRWLQQSARSWCNKYCILPRVSAAKQGTFLCPFYFGVQIYRYRYAVNGTRFSMSLLAYCIASSCRQRNFYIRQHAFCFHTLCCCLFDVFCERLLLNYQVDDFGQFLERFRKRRVDKVVPGVMTQLFVIYLVGYWKLKPPKEVMVISIGIHRISFYRSLDRSRNHQMGVGNT